MIDKNCLYPIIVHAILAFLGGCSREISVIGKKGFRIFHFVSGAFVSTFVGVVTYFLCMNYGMAPWLTAALTSLAGYIGTPVLDFLIYLIKSKMESYVKTDNDKTKK
jgi:hypothetical protein